MSYAPISDYALIGDCHGAALVRRDGSIDWACLKRFDSAPLFARILDDERGGTFTVSARGAERIERRYLPDTNVLETRFVTPGGQARLIDCFTMRSGGSQRPYRQLVRVIEGLAGTVELDVCCTPRFDYGELRPWLRWDAGAHVYSAVGGDDAFVLSTDAHLDVDGEAGALSGVATVRAGERVRFSLTASSPHQLELRHVPAHLIDERVRYTVDWWRSWVQKGHYPDGEFRAAVIRSALVLKLLTCAPTGAVLAAPTTSLPEAIGGARNWDYRYSWVRDSTLTLAALLAVGHPEVATGFKMFLENATAGHPSSTQIMYGCYGERRLTEIEIDCLRGYRGSRPVRIGNAAAKQRQLDIYGELLDATRLWQLTSGRVTALGWPAVRAQVDAAAEAWREPDCGLWETRDGLKHFVYSKVMCWVALDRGLSIAEHDGHGCDAARWRRVRDEIRARVMAEGVDHERGCFVQAFGSRELDASLLRLAMVGFVAADHPLMCATVNAIEKELMVDGLLLRYRPERAPDGLPGGEGAFLMVSFWLADVLVMQGRIDEAEALIRRLVGLGSELGLLSEEYAPDTHELIGNFPQAFTHVALIDAVEQLRRARAGAGSERAVSERPHHHHERRAVARATHHHASRR